MLALKKRKTLGSATNFILQKQTRWVNFEKLRWAFFLLGPHSERFNNFQSLRVVIVSDPYLLLSIPFLLKVLIDFFILLFLLVTASSKLLCHKKEKKEILKMREKHDNLLSNVQLRNNFKTFSFFSTLK